MTYETNFHRGKKGNALSVGEDLNIKRGNDCVYIIGRLFKIKRFGFKKMIQIEQTGTRQNPESNSITFEMKKRKNGKTIPMPKGKYLVTSYVYRKKIGGTRYKDKFEVEDIV